MIRSRKRSRRGRLQIFSWASVARSEKATHWTEVDMYDEAPSIGFHAAQRAVNNGALLVKLQTSFCTAGGTAYSHVLHSSSGKTYKVSRRIADALHVPERGALQCQARGCDGCSRCGYPAGYMQQRGAA